jgi:hypothetical protein
VSLDDGREEEKHAAGADQPAKRQQAISALSADFQRFVQAYKTYREEHDANEREKYVWEKRTARGVWLYTLLTVGIVAISLCQLRTSRDTEERQLRAYVSVNDVIVTTIAGTLAPDNSKWRLNIGMQNTGTTPTERATVRLHAEVRDSKFSADFVPQDEPTDITDPGNIAPHAAITSRSVPESAISTAELIQVRDHSKFLYVWGWSKYWDVFRDTNRHITKFFYQVEVYGDVEHAFEPGAFFRGKWLIQPTGNCTDDECDGKQ